MPPPTDNPEPEKQETYEAGCHCGYISFSVTLSPPLPEFKPMQCSCSACRRFGYLLAHVTADKVHWHGDSQARLSRYRFNTKLKDQLFCGHCGASIGIDFREWHAPKHLYGISVRTFNGIDLNALEYRLLQGVEKVAPARDLSGVQWEIDERERAEADKGREAEMELAVGAEIA